MPEPTPLRLSSAEDRFRSGVSAGLLGESAEMAQDASGLLDEISPGPPRASVTKPSKTALAGPKTAAGESCKQQLDYQPSCEFSIAYAFWVAVFGFLQTTSFWCRPWGWVISPPHAVKVPQVARVDTGTSEWSCWVPTGKVRASLTGDRVRQEYSSSQRCPIKSRIDSTGCRVGICDLVAEVGKLLLQAQRLLSLIQVEKKIE